MTTRREFFTRSGIIAGGLAAAGALAVPVSARGEFDKPHPDVKENQVTLPPNGKSVVVVGGGLAGMQAGVELAARGFKVTVLEKAANPGGKLRSWRDKTWGPADDDPSFPGYIREHAVHGVWGYYHNLREFLGRYGWQLADTIDGTIYNYTDKTLGTAKIPMPTWPAPYDRLQLLHSMSEFGLLSAEDKKNLTTVVGKLASYDYNDPKQTAYLDGISFENYLKGMNCYSPGIAAFFTSFCELGYYEGIDKASALTLARETILFVGSPNDLKMNFYRNPTAESFLKPMADYIRAHGGEVRYFTDVDGVEVTNGQVTAVKALPISRQVIKRCSVCGNLIFDGMEVGHECPYCGANADMLRSIAEHERAERRFEADYFVCALDGPGLNSFLGRNLEAFGNHEYFRRASDIKSKSVYVCNMWFEGKGYWEKALKKMQQGPSPVLVTTGYENISVMINRSMRARTTDGKQWAWSDEYLDKDVTVIEVHLPRAEKVSASNSKDIATLCYQDIKHFIPDLPEFKGWYVNRWNTYMNCEVGEEAKRPAVQSPIDNLMFIGDIVSVPHTCQWMEKTNVTAKWATNLILDKAGQKEGRITILPSAILGLPTRALTAGKSVYLPAHERA
ncbi:FAD-dependent oxidoreductase [Aromatoleum diolicum]|uniref:FAD-dependent oxidoreductase n=1 Tax=Aromatoleum diolicum TaxID=75796 RepID=A0ABX1QFZ9_9RHOO|nr:FAD-dependent oxidoreductase [Aromatoleum diolicum]NMG76422.1 FAD-dependent oxidoreductase [Aromatoleum diolicum]